MVPVLTPAAMAVVDAAAAASLGELIEAAGWCVARQALDLLGGPYGRRVAVIAGKGNNGADGRVAARILRSKGVSVTLVAPADGAALIGFDLVIDAAFGTGFRGTFDAPRTDAPIVVAVDIPSGIDGSTGAVCGTPLRATHTVTFAAPKPGLLVGEGPAWCGEIVVADIGLDLTPGIAHDGASLEWLRPDDLVELVPGRPRNAHKWNSAVWIIGGSGTMPGAPALSALGAQRSGAGYVRVGTPGVRPSGLPIEAVAVDLPEAGWASDVLAAADRVRALVVGPGLGRSDAAAAAVRTLAERSTVPVIFDADALHLLDGPIAAPGGAILTPHDGEFAALMGAAPGPDRISAARSLAARFGAVALLKGPTTVIAAPDGSARLCIEGDERLATAGTGDVLSGVIAAMVARGATTFDAASAGALAHGLAAQRLGVVGAVASDLATPLAELLSNAVSTKRRRDDRNLNA